MWLRGHVVAPRRGAVTTPHEQSSVTSSAGARRRLRTPRASASRHSRLQVQSFRRGPSREPIWEPIAPNCGGRAGIRTVLLGSIHAQSGSQRTASNLSSRPTDQRGHTGTVLSRVFITARRWQQARDGRRAEHLMRTGSDLPFQALRGLWVRFPRGPPVGDVQRGCRRVRKRLQLRWAQHLRLGNADA